MALTKFRRFFKSKKIDEFFLNVKKPFEAKRTFKKKTLLFLFAGLLAISCVVILCIPTNEAPPPANFPKPDISNLGKKGPDSSGGMSSAYYTPPTISYPQNSNLQQRSRNANQVIRRTAQNSDSLGQIPIGTTVQATLVNAVISTNSNTPVIAILPAGFSDSGNDIPAGTKAIGSATLDEPNQRMMVRFATFVYPDGEQHPVSGFAMMPDGSAGLLGDFSSGTTSREAGRFISHFVAGMADGMKEQIGGNGFSGPFEPGSIKNGILGGVAESAQDQAQDYSNSLSNAHASMRIAPGMGFLLYLEKEFTP